MLQEIENQSIDELRLLLMDKMARVVDHFNAQAARKQPIHAVQQLDADASVVTAVKHHRRNLDRSRHLRRAATGIRIEQRSERRSIVAERGFDGAGLAETFLERADLLGSPFPSGRP